jgi:membrane protein required for colicin V production
MTLFDYVVIAVIALSVLLSVMRGLVREVLALAAWVLAFIAASFFSADVAALLPASIRAEELRLLIGFAGIFLVALLVLSLLTAIASRLVISGGLGAEDRVLGGIFGLVRGLVVIMILVLAAGLTPLPRHAAWREAVLSKPVTTLAKIIKTWLPEGLSRRITYD